MKCYLKHSFCIILHMHATCLLHHTRSPLHMLCTNACIHGYTHSIDCRNLLTFPSWMYLAGLCAASRTPLGLQLCRIQQLKCIHSNFHTSTYKMVVVRIPFSPSTTPPPPSTTTNTNKGPEIMPCCMYVKVFTIIYVL